MTGTAPDSWLLIGSASSIGQVLGARLQRDDRIIYRTSRRALPGTIQLTLGAQRPVLPAPVGDGVAVLTAAATGQLQCEIAPEATRVVNVHATVALAYELLQSGWRLIYLSSEAVFPENVGRCSVDTPRQPRNEYGRQKVAVEEFLDNHQDRASILRLGKVLDLSRPPWIEWLPVLEAGGVCSAFSDYCLSPLTLPSTADAIISVAESALGGIWHAAAGEPVTYEFFLRALARHKGLRGEVVGVKRLPRSTPSGDPTFLDSTRLAQVGPWATPSVEDMLMEWADSGSGGSAIVDGDVSSRA